MILDWGNLISDKWSSLIGRPRLTLKNHSCGNIVCGKDNRFKKYIENKYMCECGYIIEGEFEITKHPLKLYCGTSKCPEGKTKMTKDCIKCSWIRER